MVNIYRVINGKYLTNDLVEEIEIYNVKIFCDEWNVIESKYNNQILICRDTKQPKYFIK